MVLHSNQGEDSVSTREGGLKKVQARQDSARLEGAQRTSQKARSPGDQNSRSTLIPTSQEPGVPHREHFRQDQTIVIASAVVSIIFPIFFLSNNILSPQRPTLFPERKVGCGRTTESINSNTLSSCLKVFELVALVLQELRVQHARGLVHFLSSTMADEPAEGESVSLNHAREQTLEADVSDTSTNRNMESSLNRFGSL